MHKFSSLRSTLGNNSQKNTERRTGRFIRKALICHFDLFYLSRSELSSDVTVVQRTSQWNFVYFLDQKHNSFINPAFKYPVLSLSFNLYARVNMSRHQSWHSVITTWLSQHCPGSRDQGSAVLLWVPLVCMLTFKTVTCALECFTAQINARLKWNLRDRGQTDKQNDSGFAIKHDYLSRDYNWVKLFNKSETEGIQQSTQATDRLLKIFGGKKDRCKVVLSAVCCV